MKLENQVVSLELAHRLKKLGVEQQSYFKWVGEGVWDQGTINEYQTPRTPAESTWLAAFTVAELGEMLPVELKSGSPYYLECWKNYPGWTVQYKNMTHILCGKAGNTEAEARGLMLAYLIENHLITV